MSLVGFRAKNHPQQVAQHGADDATDERITPDEIYVPLHERHHFTLDAAASASNTKCDKFYDLMSNGLSQTWAGEVVWCNPPYSNLLAWVSKAYGEVINGECPKAVLLLPANRCEQGWWQSFIEPWRDRGLSVRVKTSFLPGRPRFGWPEGRVTPKKGDRPPFGLVVVTFS